LSWVDDSAGTGVVSDWAIRDTAEMANTRSTARTGGKVERNLILHLGVSPADDF
jgi:hypothetical protein